ncbi:NAD(P)/FAD-dependent oxidoreductase [Halobacillus andaensis]|uniref:NAD(P)/FAD-dependent oxidoreductase n=1 Tax=Halobacillus andaensis TaxID=1176239 RepID=UPI003D761625
MQTNSLWRDIDIETFPSLTKDLTAEVTIIGGGITGITTAYLLVKQGYKVVLLEAGRLLEGTTGYTTAKVTSQHGLIYDYLIRTFGRDKARLYYQANEDALKLIEQIQEELNIDCDFSRQDAYVYSVTDKGKQEIYKEAEAYEKIGINGGIVKNVELPFEVTSAIKIREQAQFHPIKYLQPMVQYLKEHNTPIFENTRASDVEKGELLSVITREGNSVTSNHVVMASHFPFKDFEGMYFSRLHVERSYSIALPTNEVVPEGMYLNAENPKRSLRHYVSEEGEMLLLVGGEGHASGQKENTKECYEKLQSYSKEYFNTDQVTHRWSSQDITTLDKVPFIGPVSRNNPRQYTATGFSKWGMTNGTIAAKVISDRIQGSANPYA